MPVGDVEGLGVPDFVYTGCDNPAGDGAFPGVDLYGPRTVRVEDARHPYAG